jgi:hypothetical protein
MNLAFEVSKDKPLAKADFEPFRIVNLWDMLRYCAEDFVAIAGMLTKHGSLLDTKNQVHSIRPDFTRVCEQGGLVHPSLVGASR